MNNNTDFKQVEFMRYKIELSVLHGLDEGALNEAEKLEMILIDATFKIEAIFAAVSLVGNTISTRNMRLDIENLMQGIDHLSQIGTSIVSKISDGIQDLERIANKSEVKKDEKS